VTPWLQAVAFALAAVVFEASANAQQGVGIEVVEYGIYTAETKILSGQSAEHPRNEVSSLCHIATTDTVPARLGLHFGFRFRTAGSPEGQPVQFRKDLLISPNDAGRGPITVPGYMITALVGRPKYTGYQFGTKSEWTPGVWRFRLWRADKLVSTVGLNVVESGSIQPNSHSTCFPMSQFSITSLRVPA